MNIIGISAHFHDSACCLLKDGMLVAAAEEERFTRSKHDPRIPTEAFRYCLEQGDLAIADIHAVAYYESPLKKAERQIWTAATQRDAASDILAHVDPTRPEYEIREQLGYDGPVLWFEHHQSHAAGAYYFSGFRDAALLTMDGVGEWATSTYGVASDGVMTLFEDVQFPHSIGLLYSTLTAYLGFDVNDAEYKVMGLASYGKPRYIDQVQRLLHTCEAGQFRLDMRYFDFSSTERMHTSALGDLFGHPPRTPESAIDPFHEDLARSLQVVLEDVLLQKVRYLHSRTGCDALCMSGGVALNCVANGMLRQHGPFKHIFIPPAASDAGSCIGAAALAHLQLHGRPLPCKRLPHAYLGPEFSNREIALLLDAASIEPRYFADEEGLLAEVSSRLAAGQAIGWFHGRMEFGPRALGARSILADPRAAQMRERVNRLVKKREVFRPFAPAVLEERAAEHFRLDHPAPFMLETAQVCSPLALPAVTHVDGSARVQTVSQATSPRFWRLLRAFERRTGCPILLNTSFNLRGEPIVCSPKDALLCFASSDLDALVLESYVIPREALPPRLTGMPGRGSAPPAPVIVHQAYTFI